MAHRSCRQGLEFGDVWVDISDYAEKYLEANGMSRETIEKLRAKLCRGE